MAKAARRFRVLVMVMVMVLSALGAKVTVTGKAGAARLFQMNASGQGGFLLDGISGGVDALFEMDGDNKVAVAANVKRAMDNSMSLLTFSTSFYRDAEIADGMRLFMESGVETHLVLTDAVSTELGVAVRSGISYDAGENFSVVMSAAVRNMFFSTTCATLGSSKGSASMLGMDAGIECSYRF